MSKSIAKTWTFKSSSNPNKAHETIQYADGSISCGCMGWTRRVAADGSRTCKHTRMVQQGIADNYADSVWTDSNAQTVPTVARTAPVVKQKLVATPVRKVNWRREEA